MDGEGARSDRARAFFVLGAILVATAAVYARSLAGELVYDDRLLIARNPLIADLANLPRLFSSGYWDFLGLQDAENIGYWRPLTAIVEAFVYRFAGSAPGPYHGACLVVHLCATAAAFALARRLTGTLWIAAGTALLFALHPAHVESVAWISALNDPLFGCCALLALERYLAWRQRGSVGIPLAAALAFGVALLAKELGAALLPLVLALDLGRRREPGEAPGRWGGFHSTVRAYGPFVSVFALYLVARMFIFQSPFAGFERVVTDFRVGFWRLALLRLEVLGGALEILLVPIELNLFRPFRPYLSPFDPALVRAAVFTALFAALVVACFRRQRRPALFALLVIPAGLLPALVRVESLGIFPLSERFLYVPVFGFALAGVLLLERLFSRRSASAALLIVAGLYAARTWERCGFFHDEETLFRRAAAESPRSVYVQWGLGRVLLERFNVSRDPRTLQEAFRVFEHAQELLLEAKEPRTDLMATSRDNLQVNLGLALCYIGEAEIDAYGSPSTALAILDQLEQRITEIQEQERQARALGVRVAPQSLDLERVHAARGVALAKAHRYPEAEEAFQKALALQPAFAEAHLGLGRMYAELGRWEEARAELERTTQLWPGNPEARLALAQVLQTMGQAERAAALALELVDELPHSAAPFLVLAASALAGGDTTRALSWIDRALGIDPRNGLAWYQKARALLLRNEPPEAVTAFRNAVELAPTSFEAHYDFGAYLLNSGALQEALPLLARAYALAPPQHRPALHATLERMEFPTLELPFQLALADWNRGELDPALAWVARALALAPEHGECLLLEARILRKQERHDEALAALRKACDVLPTSFSAWSELGGYLHERGRDAEAKPVLEHALELELPAGWPAELRTSSKQQLRELLQKLEGEEPAANPGN